MKQIIALLLGVFMLTACGKQQQNSNKPVLTVTIEPLRYFTEAIAGDKYKVICMVPASNSPETYDPTPQQLVGLSKSTAYLRIGYIGFEQTWLKRLQASAPHLPFVDTSLGVEVVEGHSHGKNAAIDPHIWNSTRNARIIADNIYRSLCKLDGQNQAYYKERLDSLNLVIDRTEKTIRALMFEAKSTDFLIYHPALTYFARDYGLHQLCIEEGGKEPSPAHLQKLIRECRAKKVKTVFIQQEFDTRNAEVIAREIGAKLIPVNPLNYNWEEEMIRIAQAFVE